MDLHEFVVEMHADLRGRLADAVVELVPQERWKDRPDSGSSIAWLLLHMARHADLAVTTAIRDQPPLFLAHQAGLGLARRPAWCALGEEEDTTAVRTLDTRALAAYLDATLDACADALDALGSLVMDTRPDTAARLTRHARLPRTELPWLFDMWDERPVSWLIRWPVLGHGYAHLGEATAVRNRMGLSPF